MGIKKECSIIAQIYWKCRWFRLKFRFFCWYYMRKESPKDAMIDLENLSDFEILHYDGTELYQIVLDLMHW